MKKGVEKKKELETDDFIIMPRNDPALTFSRYRKRETEKKNYTW